MTKIKSILVSHPAPNDESSPYYALAKTWGLNFDFMNFFQIEGLSTSEFRKQNINLLEHTATIFTSKHAIDNYFRICKDLRIEMPADMKYFCVSESTAKYLQKYIVIRKRKLFVGDKQPLDLLDLMKKHSKDKYLYPCGESTKSELVEAMEKLNYEVKEARVYQTILCDLQQVKADKYDAICFFSPTSIDALMSNFPDYQQQDKIIAVFGTSTAKAAQDAGLRLDIQAPAPGLPSMTMAIEHFLKSDNGKTENGVNVTNNTTAI